MPTRCCIRRRSTASMPAPRALVTELAMGCLRRRGELDFLLEKRLRKAVEALDVEVRTALRLGAYQLRCMDRAPPAAAVSDSRRVGQDGAQAFGSRLGQRRSAQSSPAAGRRGTGRGARIPDWLRTRWEKQFGRSALPEAACGERLPAAHLRSRRPKASTLRIRCGNCPRKACPSSRPAFRARSGWRAAPSRIRGRSAAAGWLLQDLSSQLVVPLLCVKPGQKVLDLCAAPGGKARQLAEEAGCAAAADRSLRRLRTLRRLGSRGLLPLALDAERPLPFRAASTASWSMPPAREPALWPAIPRSNGG